MSHTIERRLFLHATTDRALLVSTTSVQADAERDGGWLPRSQVSEVGPREAVANPRADQPAAAAILGTIVTLQAPAWLFDRRGIKHDAVVA